MEASVRKTYEEVRDSDLRRQVKAQWQAARRGDSRASSGLWADHETSSRLWAHAVTTAHRARLEQMQRDREAVDAWQAARSEAAVARSRIRSLGSDLSQTSFIAARQTVEIAWARAERLAQAGNYEAAAAAARQSTAAADLTWTAWQQSHARFEDLDLRRGWESLHVQAIEDSRREGIALVIDKLRRRLHLWRNGKPIASYPVELGRRGLERKLQSGDQATPEGRYRVISVKGIGQTRFHRALLLDYPNGEDRQRLREAIRSGRAVPGTQPGGLIEIHGDGGRGHDWTDGCVALRSSDMDTLWPWMRRGLSVTIVGTLP